MSEAPGKQGFRAADRPRRGPMTWWGVALIWASGVIFILVLWALFANGKPVDWALAVAIALICPTIGIIPVAGWVRERAQQPGRDDVRRP
jgi:hypothetical protein